MPAANWTLPLEQGATFHTVLTLNALDLTGYTAALQVRRSHSADEVLFAMSTGPDPGGITITGGADSTVDLYVPDETTAAFTWRRGVYDLELTSAGGEVTRLLQGAAVVDPEVTRPDPP